MGPAVSHKTDLAGNGKVCNVAKARQAETDLLASHKMENAKNSVVHQAC